MADSTEAGHVEEMGLGRRMIGVFFSPGATFESVRSRVSTSDWLVPLILLAIVAVVTVYMTAPIIQKMSMEQMQTSMGQDEQVMEKMQTIGNVAALVGAPVGVAAALFVISLVLLALARFILGGETTYKHVLTVNCLSSLICIPSAIVVSTPDACQESVYVQVGFWAIIARFYGRDYSRTPVIQPELFLHLAICAGRHWIGDCPRAFPSGRL